MSGPIESRHWRRNLAVCLVGSFTTIVGMTMLLPYLPLYVERLGVQGEASIVRWSGIAYAATFLAAAATAPLWGRLGDRFGRKPMLVRASLGMAISIALTGLAQDVTQLVLLRLLTGVLGGYASGSVILVAAQTPKAHSASALGVLSIGVMAGTVVGPLIGGVAPGAIGVRTSFLVVGGLIFLAFLATALGLREERPVRAAAGDATRDPSATDDAVVAGGVAPGDVARAPGRPGAADPPAYRGPLSAWGPDRRRVAVLLGTASLLMFATMSLEPVVTVFVGQLEPGTDHVAELAGIVMAVGALGSIASARRLGRLADRIGHSRVITGALVVAALAMALQSVATHLWELIALRFAAGVALGGLLPAITAAIRHAVPDGVVGRVLGLSVSAQYVGQVLGPVIGGVVAGAFGLRSVFLMTAVVLLLGALVSRVGAPPRPGLGVAADPV